MKKRIKLLLCLTAIICLSITNTAYAAANAPLLGTPKLDSFAEIDRLLIQDTDTDTPLLSKNSATPFQPAGGTVAWMTALIAKEKLTIDQKVTIGDLTDMENGARKIGLRRNRSATVRDLLASLLLYGAQDSAIALANAAAGSTEGFVARMNAKAQELGMAHTHYTNPTGSRKEDQQTTADDTLKLARAVLGDPVLGELLSLDSYEVNADTDALRDPTIQNRCTLMQKDHPQYTPEVTGAALGFTNQTGTVAVISAQKDGCSILVIFNDNAPKEDFETSALALLEYAFSFEKMDLSPYVMPMAQRISLQAGEIIVQGCTLEDQPLIFSAYQGFQNEFLSVDLRLIVDEASLREEPKVNEPVADASLYYGDTKLADVTLLAQSIQPPAQTEPTAVPVTAFPIQVEENPPRLPLAERYRWVVWPACAAIPAVILILLSKGILRKIR